MESTPKAIFHGQQDNENILSTITPHKLAFTLEYAKLYAVSFFFLIGFLSFQKISPLFVFVGAAATLLALFLGSFFYRSIHSQRIAYITNRRIVRFEPSNAFVVNTRSLTWDNIIKVKTFPPNFIWRTKNIGTVIIHSKTTSTDVNDDIILRDVHYYKDLGNYLDKILYLYVHDQKELDNIHPFVAKPKGQRY